ncbi:TPA: ParB/RepB/Spo0J family partition protein [Yersinia enterocolitica]|nr:ParB N-terminal domain-containing protein [Yersinia enterocolitica]HEI6967570.1 ParB N-terminal domain-containing protein [Yersinia enterocolitica]
MSNIDTKATAKVKATPKNSKVAAKVNEALANTPTITVPLHRLVSTELNVRKKKSAPASIAGLAASIESVGLLQNLIVFLTDEGNYGVAGGERRHLAFELLLSENRSTPAGLVTADYPIDVKVFDKNMARLISYTENGKREDMHPADQVTAFRDMASEGRTPVQIGSLLGYSTKHVQKCLRLASMAPMLLAALAKDEINLDQLQALSASEDHERQSTVWSNAYGYYKQPEYLRSEVLRGEISAENNGQLAFIGREAYEQAGGAFRYDLFTEEGFISDPVLLERLTREKLAETAAIISREEGWKWAEGRMHRVYSTGDDAELYSLLRKPTPIFTDEESARMAILEQLIDAYNIEHMASEEDESDACQKELDAITETADIRAWSNDVRTQSGIVAYLNEGELVIQRGVMLLCDVPVSEEISEELTTQHPQYKPLSAALVKSLSSERTMAVQAALAQQPDVALAIFIHDCIKSVFHPRSFTSATLRFSLYQNKSTLVNNAPTVAKSRAMQVLEDMHIAWEANFPDGWETDYQWLMGWDKASQIALLTYCVAGTLDGVTEQMSRNNKAGESLEPVEASLNFDIHDWWQPTKANFFGRIGKDGISDALTDAGLTGAASDSQKMKKGDAAELAEEVINKTSWMPACIQRDVVEQIQPQTETSNNIDIAA